MRAAQLAGIWFLLKLVVSLISLSLSLSACRRQRRQGSMGTTNAQHSAATRIGIGSETGKARRSASCRDPGDPTPQVHGCSTDPGSIYSADFATSVSPARSGPSGAAEELAGSEESLESSSTTSADGGVSSVTGDSLSLSLSLCLSLSFSLSLCLALSLSSRIQVIVSWLASELLESPCSMMEQSGTKTLNPNSRLKSLSPLGR